MCDCTVTIRLIRSFEYRNIKHVVYKNVDFSQTTEQFIDFIKSDMKSRKDLPPPFRNTQFETLKIQHKAFGAKTSDPVINTEDDEKLMLRPGVTLKEAGVEHETEISFFKLEDYKSYQKNPTLKW